MSDTQTLDQTLYADLPVAGWYDDPAGTNQLRWWGGLAWTEYLKPVAPAPGPARASFAEVSTTLSYGSAQNYVPFATYRDQTPTTTRPRKGGGTTAIWVLVFTPILSVTLQLLVTGVGPSISGSLLLPAQLAQVAVFVGLFLWDRASLRSLEMTPSSAWWLLLPSPIVYLIVRRVTLKRQGVISHAPSNAYVLVLIVAVALAALVGALIWR